MGVLGIFKDKVLPLIVFPALSAAAFNLLIGHASEAGITAKLDAQCGSPNSSLSIQPEGPYALDYTGVQSLDIPLCKVVTLFHVALAPNNKPFFIYFFASMGSTILLLNVEASRRTPGAFLGNPLPAIVSTVSQVMSLGATLPLYYVPFFLSGAHRRKGDQGTRVIKVQVDAICFATSVAVFIPTLAMFTLDNPYITALHQGFPVYAFLIQNAYLLLRSEHLGTTDPTSGYKVVQTVHILNFLHSAVTHYFIVLSPLTNGDEATTLKEFHRLFVPSLSALDSTATLEEIAMNIFKWDLVMSLSAGILATLWFARNLTELMAIVGWYVMISLSVGPGAAASGVIAWRESVLNAEEEAKVAEKQKKKMK